MAKRNVTLERKAQAAVQTPVVCVQMIKTAWSKQSRGGPSAVLRNQVPEALPLALLPPTDDPSCFLYQQIAFGERNGFEKPIEQGVSTSETLLQLGCLRLTRNEEALNVFYQYNRSQGAPERYSSRLPALRLSVGEWGRVLHNGRHVDHDDGTWWYVKSVFNIGLFSEPRSGVFLSSEPVKIYSQMAHLF